MNKQELIEKYENKLKDIQLKFGANFKTKVYEGLVEDLRQLDEPKVTIPQFVADWIERSKQENRNLRNALNNGGEKMRLWFLDQENYDLFGRAWLDGYEVEKEKRYTVKIKGLNPNYSVLKYHPYDKTWFFGKEQEYEFFRPHHTRKELEEADFGGVFDSPLFEVEEVTE